MIGRHRIVVIRRRGATQDGRAAVCSANRPDATAGSPTQAGGQLITLWWQFVSCPATRETGTHAAVHVPLTSRLIRLPPAPAGPARACWTVLSRSSPGAFRCARACLFLAPRPDDRPRFSDADRPDLQNSMADLPVGRVHTKTAGIRAVALPPRTPGRREIVSGAAAQLRRHGLAGQWR